MRYVAGEGAPTKRAPTGGDMYLNASRLIDPIVAKVRPKLRSSIQDHLNPDGAYFLSPGLTPAEFHEQLCRREVASVRLPPFFASAETELLIADDHLDRVADLVTKWRGGHPVKLYSLTGGRREHRFEPDLQASAHHAVSLLPPHIARSVLDRAEPDVAGAKVPTAADAFFICAYRAAYLQRECWVRRSNGWVASEDCETRICRLAGPANISLDCPITPAKVDDLLERSGWRPSLDLLERAAHWMPWIRSVLPAAAQEEEPGITLFFIRARAMENGWAPKIIDCVREHGFEPLSVVELDDVEMRKAALEFRGGNWGQGPYQLSGGPPAVACVALDLLPVVPDARHRSRFPNSDNRRAMDAKYAAREIVNRGVAKAFHYNPVHSTDNSAEAWRAVQLIMPGRELELRRKAEMLRGEFASGGVLRDFTKHGRRAKVELIRFEGALAIRKTYRPSALRFMTREIEVMEQLAPICREIPRLLQRGSNYIVMEYVGEDATLPRKHRPGDPPRPLPLRHVRRLAQLIRAITANGFDPIDLRADGNILYSRSGLHLIDFEFWRKCAPGPPEKSMCLCGIPASDAGDRPLAGRRNDDPYAIGWYPYTLLSARSFLHDSSAAQHIKRSVNLACAWAAWGCRASFSLVRRMLRRALRKAMTTAIRLLGTRATRFLALQ